MLPDGFIAIRNDPAAEAELAAGIFRRSAGGLNDTVQADEDGNDELAHEALQVDGPARSADTTNDSDANRQAMKIQRPGMQLDLSETIGIFSDARDFPRSATRAISGEAPPRIGAGRAFRNTARRPMRRGDETDNGERRICAEFDVDGL